MSIQCVNYPSSFSIVQVLPEAMSHSWVNMYSGDSCDVQVYTVRIKGADKNDIGVYCTEDMPLLKASTLSTAVLDSGSRFHRRMAEGKKE